MQPEPPTSPTPTVTAAVESYIALRIEREDWSPQTVRRTGDDLRRFAGLWPDDPITAIDADRLRAYLAAISTMAVASQRSRYHAVAGWLQWCVARCWLSRHPAERLSAEDLPWRGRRGRRALRRGKAQLRNGAERDAYLAQAAALDTPERRVGAALPLLTGMRSAEIRHLRCCDVDFVLSYLWVRSGADRDDGWAVKTDAGVRTADLPPTLAQDLHALTDGRPDDAYVLGEGVTPRGTVWLWKLVGDVCEAAGVRRVCPHGLRGTWATHSRIEALERQRNGSGDDLADLARRAGHGDGGTTLRRHYLGAVDHAPALQVQDGTKQPEP